MECKSIKGKSQNMYKRALRVLLTLFFEFMMMLLVGCKPTLVGFKRVDGDGIELTEIKQNDSIISIINDYIKRHPKYNTFVLSRPILLSWDDSIVLKGLILGPGYRPLYGDGEKWKTYLPLIQTSNPTGQEETPKPVSALKKKKRTE